MSEELKYDTQSENTTITNFMADEYYELREIWKYVQARKEYHIFQIFYK